LTHDPNFVRFVLFALTPSLSRVRERVRERVASRKDAEGAKGKYKAMQT
jgi:hypothetical protein